MSRIMRDTAKDKITIYNMYPYIKDGKLEYRWNRTVLEDVSWKQDSKAQFLTTGIADKDAVDIKIPFDVEYTSVQHGELYVGVGWTVRMGPELQGSYIVKGEVDYVLEPYIIDLAGIDTDGYILGEFMIDYQPDGEYIRRIIKPFEDKFQPNRPKEIVEKFWGSRNLWFMEVRC